jgi:hypothetical protein
MQNGFNPNFYNAPSRKAQKSKLLVGSFNVDPRAKNQVAHPGIGNQAAPQNHMDVGTNIVFVRDAHTTHTRTHTYAHTPFC